MYKCVLEKNIRCSITEKCPLRGFVIMDDYKWTFDSEMSDELLLFTKLFLNDNLVKKDKLYLIKELEGVMYPIEYNLKIDEIKPKELYTYLETFVNCLPMSGRDLTKIVDISKNLPKEDFDYLSIRIFADSVTEKIDPSIDYIIKYNQEKELDIEPIRFNKETKRFNIPIGIECLMSNTGSYLGSEIIDAFNISKKRDVERENDTIYKFGEVFINNYNHILPNVRYICNDKDDISIIRLDTKSDITYEDAKKIWDMYSNIPIFGITIWDTKRSLCGSDIKFLATSIAKNSPNDCERDHFEYFIRRYCTKGTTTLDGEVKKLYPIGYNTRYYIQKYDNTYSLKRDLERSPK